MQQEMGDSLLPRPAFIYDGRLGDIYRIFLVNLLLTIVTLGIYRFWAITRYRRYFWSHFQFQRSRFEYTGRGKELFLGFLLAIGILLGLVIATIVLSLALGHVAEPLRVVPFVLLYVIIFLLAAGARFSAQRYRLSRTVWNGIRGGMTGSALRYGLVATLYTVLLPLTLLQIAPWMQVRLAERRINASRFGSACFEMQGRARQLYLPFLASLIGVALLSAAILGGIYAAVGRTLLPALAAGSQSAGAQMAIRHAIPMLLAGGVIFYLLTAVIGCWYWALLVRHIAGHTTLERLHFSSTVTGRALLWLVFSNLVLLVITLGLGLPIVMHRNMRFFARNLHVAGRLDAAALQQSTLAMPRTGEGMLQALDHGSIF